MDNPTRVYTDGETARVYSDYAWRDTIRTIGGRTWVPESPHGKHWTIPVFAIDDLARQLTIGGCRVIVDGRSWKPPARPPGPQEKVANVFAPMLAEIPVDLRDQLCRAMTKVLHPDIGGDTVLMQQLNDARQGL